ncbi:MAG: SpoIID/LytB domain-containing protein [Tepidisphaeraceae bacterium]
MPLARTPMKSIVVAMGCAMVLAAALSGCSPKVAPIQPAQAPHVRVRLLAGVDRCTITADAPPGFTLDNGVSHRQLGMEHGQSAVVTLASGQWLINGTSAGSGVLELDPSADGSLAINGFPYHGVYRFVATGATTFDVVNDLDVEQYLQGVLGKELLADWHPEAYKAQAVIARTYALYEAKAGPQNRYWDLNPDERSQVYGGIRAESPKAIEAVQQTRGMVVTYGPPGQEKIFKAYFSSCCGGVTNSASDVFNDPPIPPLQAMYNGMTCAISPRFNWGPLTISKADLARRIRAWGVKSGMPEANLPGLANMEIASVNAYGRPQRFLLTDTKGQKYSITAEQLRWAINTDPQGGPTVFSSFFKPVDAGDAIELTEGHGFGHGVGACQWCMQARAIAGANFEQIVVMAYPHSKVLRAF